MAYEGETPTVAPSATAPDDYQRINTNPNMFGGAIAQSVGALGQGALDTAKFFGTVQTDDAVNAAMEETNKVTDSYLKMEGREAISNEQSVRDQVDKIAADRRSTLYNPEQQHTYDLQIRAYKERYINGKIGTHVIQQTRSYGKSVANSSLELTLGTVSSSPTNDETVKHAIADSREIMRNQVIADGNGGDDVIMSAAMKRADAAVYKTQADSLITTDPVRSLKILDDHAELFGDQYGALREQMKNRADRKIGGDTGDKVYDGTAGATADRVPAYSAAVQAAPNGFSSPSSVQRLARIESGEGKNVGDGHYVQGPAQLSRQVQAAYGVTDPHDYTQAMVAAQKYAADNRRYLEARVGPVDDATLYLAHQQGPAGAYALLTHPGLSAYDALMTIPKMSPSVARASINGNGGDPDAPASQFVNMWRSRFGAAPGGASTTPTLVGMTTPGNAIPAGVRFGGVQMPASVSGVPALPPPVSAPTTPVQADQDTYAQLAAGLPSPTTTDVPPPVTAPPETPPPALTPMSINERLAESLRRINTDPTLTPEQKKIAENQVKTRAATDAVMEEQTARAKKDRLDKAIEDYGNLIIAGKFDEALKSLPNDPRFNEGGSTRLSMFDTIKRAAADNDLTTFSSHFSDTLKRVLLPQGDPNRINDMNEVWTMYANGGLRKADVSQLRTIMADVHKDVDGAGIVEMQNSALSYAKRLLSFNDDMGILKDPNGAASINKFTQVFYSRLNEWKRDGKRPLSQFDLFDNDSIRQLATTIRKPADMDRERKAAMNGIGLPPTPDGADEPKWRALFSAPVVDATSGKTLSQPELVGAINGLLSAPETRVMQKFDQHFNAHGSGISARQVLEAAGVEPVDMQAKVGKAPLVAPVLEQTTPPVAAPPPVTPVTPAIPAEPPKPAYVPPPVTPEQAREFEESGGARGAPSPEMQQSVAAKGNEQEAARQAQRKAKNDAAIAAREARREKIKREASIADDASTLARLRADEAAVAATVERLKGEAGPRPQTKAIADNQKRLDGIRAKIKDLTK